jgi:hypothetical protein
MLQTSIGATLETQVSNAVAHLIIVAVMISRAIRILCASILLFYNGCHGGGLLRSQAPSRWLPRSRVTLR